MLCKYGKYSQESHGSVQAIRLQENNRNTAFINQQIKGHLDLRSDSFERFDLYSSRTRNWPWNIYEVVSPLLFSSSLWYDTTNHLRPHPSSSVSNSRWTRVSVRERSYNIDGPAISRKKREKKSQRKRKRESLFSCAH